MVLLCVLNNSQVVDILKTSGSPDLFSPELDAGAVIMLIMVIKVIMLIMVIMVIILIFIDLVIITVD